MRLWWSRFYPALQADGSDPDIRQPDCYAALATDWFRNGRKSKPKGYTGTLTGVLRTKKKKKKTFSFSCWKTPSRQLKTQVIFMCLKPEGRGAAKGEHLSYSGNSINIHWVNEHMNNAEHRILRNPRNPSWKPSHLPLNSHNFSELFTWCFIVTSESALALPWGANAFLILLTCIIYKTLCYPALPLQRQLLSFWWYFKTCCTLNTQHTLVSVLCIFSRILHLLRTNKLPSHLWSKTH